MDTNLAAENLQVIRTLMERSALYRRALAPIMIFTGAVGLLAAFAGWKLQLCTARSFTGFWLVVAFIAMAGSLLMVRRQAWRQAEPFWSPPTRRVAQAALPALTAGFILGLLVLAQSVGAHATQSLPTPEAPNRIVLICMPLAWVILYGCAAHAAGFFATRGLRLFGWVFLLGGCAGFVAAGAPPGDQVVDTGYIIMGSFFGILHLGYGVYLYFTEPRELAA